jgi:hypothetical protein
MSQRAPKTEHARRRSTVTADSFIGAPPLSTYPSHQLTYSPEHKPFLSDKFDVHDYANAVLHGRTYQPDGEVGLLSSAGGLAPPVPASPARPKESGDLGVEVARLNYGIEDVTRQLRQEVSGFKLVNFHLHMSIPQLNFRSPRRTPSSSRTLRHPWRSPPNSHRSAPPSGA